VVGGADALLEQPLPHNSCNDFHFISQLLHGLSLGRFDGEVEGILQTADCCRDAATQPRSRSLSRRSDLATVCRGAQNKRCVTCKTASFVRTETSTNSYDLKSFFMILLISALVRLRTSAFFFSLLTSSLYACEYSLSNVR
jgi:hypothetical protein